MRLRHRFCLSADVGSFFLTRDNSEHAHGIGHKASIILGDAGAVSRAGQEERRGEPFQAQAEEPLGIDTHQIISKRSSKWWLLIGHKKMLRIIVPNRQTASPELFCNFKTTLAGEICTSDVNMLKSYLLFACLKNKSRFLDV